MKPNKTGRKKSAKTQQETLKLTIDSLDSDGIGLAAHDNRTALVQGAFPGETVLVEVAHTGRTHIYTQLRKVLRRSPARSAQRICSREQLCQGCSLICMSYRDQLLFKQQRVAEALHRQGLLADLTIPPVLAAESPTGYRASAKLAFSREQGKVQLGLYQRGSHRVVDCSDCPVHHPLINRIVTVVRREVERQRISIYQPRQQRGLLRYLLIRVSPVTGKALVTFVSSSRNLRELPKLGKWLIRTVPEVIGVHQNINASSGNVILGEEMLKLHGKPDLLEEIGDIRLRIAPTAFFQINTLQAGAIYRKVRDWARLDRRQSAIDLYCGIGGIALHLAGDAGQVFGVESVPAAVRNAETNARLNGLENCRFSAGDAAEHLARLCAGDLRPALVTLNPPRKGCSGELLASLARQRPPQIIYVSCDPDSLARDLRILVDHGYRIERLQPVDMFPQTAHIETLVQLRLTRSSPAQAS